jgi:CBS-domain-containing membrane protein
MRRSETDTEEQRSWWLRALVGSETLAKDYVRSHARRVADVMTTDVLTASPRTSLRELAAQMERKRIKRLPIVENGKLVGIVSRSNLMQAFASMEVLPASPAAAGDKDIRDQVLSRLRSEKWSSTNSINVIVQKGVVELWGAVNSESEHKAVRIVAESTPGVASVKDNLVVGLTPSGI